MVDASIPYANSETPLLEEEPDSKLVLYADSEAIDGTTPICLTPGEQQQITAKVVPEATSAAISWESSDDGVATVKADAGGTATVTAATEGYARITASCRGITASLIIDVVKDKADNDKILDLSGDIRVAGFEKESDKLVYNGQKITQDFRVYHKDKLLTERVDYTLSYRNNVNAAEWDSAKAPSVTINLRGQYQGSVTLYYTIKPLDINQIDIYNSNTTTDGSGSAVKKSPGYEQTVNYSKKLNIPAPVLTFGKRKLAVKKDFFCDYSAAGENLTPLPADYKNGDLYEAGKVYSYIVRGTGNFTGSFPMTFIVLKDKNLNFNSASVKLNQTTYKYCGTPLSRQDVKIAEVKIGGQPLPDTLYDYEVAANGTEGAYVMVSPSETGRTRGYRGCKKVSLRMVGDRPIRDAVFGTDWQETIPYSQKVVNKNGGIFQTGTALLAFEEAGTKKALVEGIDYTIKYSNAKRVGNVTVTFKGMGRYTGSVSKRYTITPNTSINIFMGKNVRNNNGTYETAYQKGGAVPELILKDQEYNVLTNKTDYSVKYMNNKAPGTRMTCEITGKGNYKGYKETVTLTVVKGDIGKAFLTVSDKVYDAKPNKWKSNVIVTDTNGKRLSAGTDYIREIRYTYANMDTAPVPPVGTEVTVEVTGTGFYEGTLKSTYRIFDRNKAISKLVIDIAPQIYTGEEIKLKKSDIHVYENAADKRAEKELAGKDSCFEIMEDSYKNNSKAGTARVTLHGIGDYGGTRTYSFKIQKKKYMVNRVKEITLNKASLSLSLAETNEEKRKITATIIAETGQDITNPTVVWTTSNSSVASIERTIDTSPGKDADGRSTASSTVILILNKEGSVTITATAQDSGRKAQCKVTVLEAAPILAEADTTIRKNIGETYQLQMNPATDQMKNRLTWESSNSEAVSVDKNGLLTMKKAGAAIIQAVYRSASNKTFTQQCYAVAVDPNETKPTGNILTYEQEPGTTDDTSAINALLSRWHYGSENWEALYIPAGVYHIDPVGPAAGLGGIYMFSNQKLILSSSAMLMAIENADKEYQIININVCDKVTVSGGQIVGDRQKHTGKSGEAGHGIQIWGSTNVTIKNVDISQCWGDGIYLGWSNDKYSSDITVEDCVLHHNRRSNLSVTEANNIVIKNCAFNYASGTDPQYGINIEPNHNKSCSNITISNSSFKGNAHGTIQILGQMGGKVNGVTIENCTGEKAPVIWSGYGGSVSDVVQTGNKWGK